MWFAACIAGMIIGFYYGWQLALVNLAMTPVMALSGKIATMVKITQFLDFIKEITAM